MSESKLSCGCIPDASGFGYCSECTKTLKKKIWKNMSEKRRRYDRQLAPEESKELDDDCCSCHINPPCGYCLSKKEDEID